MSTEKKNTNLKIFSPSVGDETFLEPSGMADVVLVVQGKELHTSRAILAMVSPVFRAMFESDFKEKNEKRVELPEKTFEEVLLLLRIVCHRINLRDLNTCEVLSLLRLADEYQITFLITDCERHLINEIQNDNQQTAEVCCILEVSVHHSLSDLTETCVTYLTKDPDDCFEGSGVYKNVFPEGKILILESLVQRLREGKRNSERKMDYLTRKMERLLQIVSDHDDHCNCQPDSCNKRCIPLATLAHFSTYYTQYSSCCFENMGYSLSKELKE